MFNYHKSLPDALRSAFPEVAWDLKNSNLALNFADQKSNTDPFEKSSGYWQDQSNLIKELEIAERTLGILKVMTFFDCAINARLLSKSTKARGLVLGEHCRP